MFNVTIETNKENVKRIFLVLTNTATGAAVVLRQEPDNACTRKHLEWKRNVILRVLNQRVV
jgi:hypothetical protein